MATGPCPRSSPRLTGPSASSVVRPTYVLTDNEKTVTDRHIAGIAVRNEAMVAVSNYYGVTICTCVPYDPESKGGSESTVKVAKADLVPTQANLLDEYHTFAELEEACAAAMATFNGRMHSVTRRVPADALREELAFLHRLPDAPYTAAFGESRRVGWSSVISYRGARYSVPHAHCDTRVWVRDGRRRGDHRRRRGQRGKRGGPPQDGAAWADPPSATTTTRDAPASHASVAPGRPVAPRSSSWRSAKGPSATWSRQRRAGARRLEARMAEAVLLGRAAWCGPRRRGARTRGDGRALLGGRPRIDPRARRRRTGVRSGATRRALLGPGHLVVGQLQDAEARRPDRERALGRSPSTR